MLRLFGGLELSSAAGRPIHPATRKAALLLAVLGLAGGKGVSRELLCELFWSDRGEAQARGSLRQALAAIRQALAEAGDASLRLGGDQDAVCLTADAAAVDVLLFDRLTTDGKPDGLAVAAELYRGGLLAGVALAGSADDWFAPHQRAYKRRALALSEELSGLAESGDERAAKACEALADRLLADDPTAEEAHRALIRLHRLGGRTNSALRQFGLCKEALHGLGLDPEAATLDLVAATRDAPAAAGRESLPETASPVQPIAAQSRREQPSIVVMPFDNLSGAEDEYFADGVVEEITAALSRVRNFFVIARQSALTYKGRLVDIREVGRELGVAYVVEGTVRRSGERLRISVQLVDADTRMQLWSERYDGTTADIFDFQDQIASRVAAAVHPAVRKAEIELARMKSPSSLRAYDLVMRAYPKLWGQNAEANDEAIATLQAAVAIDAGYGRAHALLAWCHALKATYVWGPDPKGELETALACAEAAAGRIDDDPTALTAAGAAAGLCGNRARGEALIEKALALDPNHAWAWTRFGWMAVYRGLADRAKERFARAMTLNPLDPFAFNTRMGIGAAMAISGSLDEAVAIARDVIERHPEVTWAYRQLAIWAALNGDIETARSAGRKLLELQPAFTIARYGMLPLFTDPARQAEMVRGLRLAGLPER